MNVIRDINNLPNIMDYLNKHKAYVSLTTSPLRINYIEEVIKHLDLTHIEYIFLNLPLVFGKDKTQYIIPDIIKNNKKIKILRMEKDYGPISKIIPSIEYIQQIDPLSIIISIDDDIIYPKGMINELIYHCILSPNVIFGGCEYYEQYFPMTYKFTWKLPFFKNHDDEHVDILEGWGSIGYVVKYVDVDFLKLLSQLTEKCYCSDDLIINFALMIDNIPRSVIHNEFLNKEYLIPMAHGLKCDSLHQKAINDLKSSLEKKNEIDDDFVNTEKYKLPYETLLNFSYNYETLQFLSKCEIIKKIKN